MTSIGTPLSSSATKLLLLGSGELGREVAIEAMRLGLEVAAADRYANAPAMQVAHKSHVLPMLDQAALQRLIEEEKPQFIVPEIEAIATDVLLDMENKGYNVIPCARAVCLTMNREGIRKLAAEDLHLPTSPYLFAANYEEYEAAVEKIGLPCIVKPIMSSSGKGQSLIKDKADLQKAFDYAQSGARGRANTGLNRLIIEGFVDFDYEITLLTVRHTGGTSFCDPIGHYQKNGDYRMSWQPQPMSDAALDKAKKMAKAVTAALAGDKNGFGIFGVEFFVKGDEVWFSEVSPRPHDTGLVTLISQNLSEFALHVRAILGLPIPKIRQYGPAASAVILPYGQSKAPVYHDLHKAISEPDSSIFIFGKPEIAGTRRMGVALALGDDIENAKFKAKKAADTVSVSF